MWHLRGSVISTPEVNKILARAGGVLAHPTSLPGPHGIGDLGADAYRFVDFLVAAGQQLWQMLPLNPPGHGESPYNALSAFAGNPLLISLDLLVSEGLLTAGELAGGPTFAADAVDYSAVTAYKLPRLSLAYRRFVDAAPPGLRQELADFTQRESDWLPDYALFMALKQANGGVAWSGFASALARRDSSALARAGRELAESVGEHEVAQFLFFRQWRRLKKYANGRGVRIVGDIPIFVAFDSADVWANQGLFYLDELGRPTVVSGVPPDVFSATGQRWGNPLYRWDELKKTGYAWWLRRLAKALGTVDILRIDHFRGFAAYWEVPAAEPTAQHGRWVDGPGADLFEVATRSLGELPIVVEDLGLITPDVIALRERVGYPGMKVLQFAFGDDSRNPYLPHNFERNCVVYTGTHDNETTRGWYADQPEIVRHRVRVYLGRDGRDVAWELIRLAWESVANLAIAPLQDVLNLGNEARMNFPGRGEGNWRWRVRPEQLEASTARRLEELTVAFGRDRASTEPLTR